MSSAHSSRTSPSRTSPSRTSPSRKIRLPLGGVLVALGVLFFAGRPAQAQLPDTSAATPDSIVERLGLPEGHSPRGALWRAAVAPGWGQRYNRQLLKMPVVFAALGGAIASVVYTWDRYLLYRNAWRYRRVRGAGFVPPPPEGEEEEYDGAFGGPKYEAAYLELVGQIEGVSPGDGLPESVRSNRDQFRRWRDLSVLGSGLVYALQIVDAYVSAHLLGFDVSENLSLRATPRPEGLAATLRLSL